MERGEIVTHVTQRRKLSYVREFRQLVREKPGVVSSALRLIQEAEKEYCPRDVQIGEVTLCWNKEEQGWFFGKWGDKQYKRQRPLTDLVIGRGVILQEGNPKIDTETAVEVSVLGISNRKLSPLGSRKVRIDKTTYLKIKLGEKRFFVKKSNATNNPAFYEFEATTKAEKILSELADLKVVEAQLGYSDNRQSLFVSTWEDLESKGYFSVDAFQASTPNDYGFYPQRNDALEVGNSKRVKDFVESVREKMDNAGVRVGDIHVNLFYNPESDNFFLLDVTTRVPEMLNQP